MAKITAKEAAQIAANYYRDVSGDNNAVSVAEVELSDDGRFWLITLAHQVQSNPVSFEIKQAYKEFKINAATGEVLSMKIKKI